MSCDPVANSGRAWALQWIAVNPIGEKFIVREFPCRGEFVEGVGIIGDWAIQGGKNTALGKRGPAQEAWSYGFSDWAQQIRRIELELGAILNPETLKPIKIEERIMDSRSGNTANIASGGGKTLIECMDDEGIFFVSAGKDTPTAGSNRYVSVGEQVIKDALVYDQEQSAYNAETKIMTFKGRSPKLFIADTCHNIIDAFFNYPGAQAGDSAWDDWIDGTRYILIAEPRFIDKTKQGFRGGGAF